MSEIDFGAEDGPQSVGEAIEAGEPGFQDEGSWGEEPWASEEPAPQFGEQGLSEEEVSALAQQAVREHLGPVVESIMDEHMAPLQQHFTEVQGELNQAKGEAIAHDLLNQYAEGAGVELPDETREELISRSHEVVQELATTQDHQTIEWGMQMLGDEHSPLYQQVEAELQANPHILQSFGANSPFMTGAFAAAVLQGLAQVEHPGNKGGWDGFKARHNLI
jgi:hypothetical protein